MEWYLGLGIFILVLLAIALGILLACFFFGQHCTFSIQKRTPNIELTQIQQEQELKRQKQFGSKVRQAFSSTKSKKSKQAPLKPVENVETVEFSFKMGKNDDDQVNDTGMPALTTVQQVNEPIMIPKHLTPKELEGRRKRREEIKKKYNL
ncbi:unnamed protein product [Didymodactylos carnosus]|uniref:Uncharacterized protein n=1 Tax=Didymodactylos carnosus TaxID=1234261 RepID=A0A813NXP4_9BILA|nr:unnamed protein product [Didymodactylos carnosus]CAF0806069.1 unnamed protein product [Didymodactylos carnosus]CAF3520676.1 unnamed protein product [Didymodactylos carnosus]CAF3589742.1 unnamed protein product [Didymodactylos carnosus]